MGQLALQRSIWQHHQSWLQQQWLCRLLDDALHSPQIVSKADFAVVAMQTADCCVVQLANMMEAFTWWLQLPEQVVKHFW